MRQIQIRKQARTTTTPEIDYTSWSGKTTHKN